MILRGIFLGVTFIAAAAGQSWSFGLAAGGSLTNAFETITTGPPGTFQERTYSQSKDYMVGLMIEYRLPWNLTVEADGLFRELHMTEAGVEINGTLNSVSPAPVVTYEFPVLGKYRFHRSGFDSSKIEPFVEAGPEFRTTGNLNAYPSHYGVAAGVGMDVYWKGLDVAPVLRYIRWAHDPPIDSFAETKSDQLELLVAISRRSRAASGAPGPHHFSIGLIAGTNLVGDYPSMSAPTTVTEAIPLPGGGYGPGSQQIPATAYQSGLNSLIGGLAVEFALPKNLYLETDALHHPLCRADRIVVSDGGSLSYFTQNFSGCGTTWEVPLLAKYKFGAGRFKPFFDAGPSVRSPRELSNYGLNAGAGVETHLGSLKIAPQIRFTRWGPETFAELAPVTRNQVLFLTTFLL